jgi:hypothetical protein
VNGGSLTSASGLGPGVRTGLLWFSLGDVSVEPPESGRHCGDPRPKPVQVDLEGLTSLLAGSSLLPATRAPDRPGWQEQRIAPRAKPAPIRALPPRGLMTTVLSLSVDGNEGSNIRHGRS